MKITGYINHRILKGMAMLAGYKDKNQIECRIVPKEEKGRKYNVAYYTATNGRVLGILVTDPPEITGREGNDSNVIYFPIPTFSLFKFGKSNYRLGFTITEAGVEYYNVGGSVKAPKVTELHEPPPPFPLGVKKVIVRDWSTTLTSVSINPELLTLFTKAFSMAYLPVTGVHCYQAKSQVNNHNPIVVSVGGHGNFYGLIMPLQIQREFTKPDWFDDYLNPSEPEKSTNEQRAEILQATAAITATESASLAEGQAGGEQHDKSP